MRNALRICAGLVLLSLTAGSIKADTSTNPAAGLWVGEVTLQRVNETVSGVNAANQVVSPDPTVTTPVNSPAHLRIILHVDSTGNVRLLKGVAMVAASPTNIVLLSDPNLYAQYGNLPGQRLTAVGFDFGDGPAPQNALTIIATAAATAAANNFGSYSTMQTAAQTAAQAALLSIQTNIPAGSTTGYSNFVQSATFASSVSIAANNAANSLKGVDASVANSRKIEIASLAAIQGLTTANVFLAADSLSLNELPLSGPSVASQTGLTGVTLTGTIYLGADHPTNPFRHKWNPIESHGYAITRKLTINFDSTNSASMLGFGVDHISGTYHESIFGLHKPLGPNQDVGLLTDGIIKLDRVSPIAVLNQ